MSRRAVAAFGSMALAAGVAAMPTFAQAAPGGSGGWTATAVSVDSVVDGVKSDSGKLAQSDKALLARTDSAMVNVAVKLDYDSYAAYTGGLAGLPATSPSVTKQRLTGRSVAEATYGRHIAKVDAAFRAAVKAKVPTARLGKSLQTVYGGVVVRVPANQAKALLALPGVAAVQSDPLNKPADLPEAAQFIGAKAIWNRIGGQPTAGKGVIFADLDTGIWPEHPMLAARSDLAAPPAAPSGQPRACDFGDNPLTPATDVFECNTKVIGGRPFLDSYNLLNPGEEYSDSARDGDGHGTHTTTTAAGNLVSTAPVFGVNRGPISGVAPGAWVLEYKVCGGAGCYGSDTTAAVGQAIMDGAQVINYSISGGSSPFSDPTELAFLDAYKAGVFVAASAGNSGPGAGTTDHHSPWVTTVAASTQLREFSSTLTVAGDGATATFHGSSITQGVPAATPIVLAQNIPGYDARCSTELAPGAADGKVVACQRGVIGRVQKGYNISKGGAVGMILYNLPLQDTETDNHFLPTVHLADGTDFLAFMAAHPSSTATFTDGQEAKGQGDVMAAFSSRGPGGQFLKPDITAPGVQVLAGHTPTPMEIPGGPAGQYYQAIAGTSMSAPNIAGSAILMKAIKPDWGPGAIKSALMTTAKQGGVVKEDLTTPADAFDYGAGRVNLGDSFRAPVVFEETGDKMATDGPNPLTAVNLNLPSINAPVMPGSITVARTARNVSGSAWKFHANTNDTGPASKISVSPASGTIPAGGSQTFMITITSADAAGQYFGNVVLQSRGFPAVHLPVAFKNTQGAVKVSQSCDPAAVAQGSTTTCTVTATNTSPTDTVVSARSTASGGLRVLSATGATVDSQGRVTTAGPATLTAPKDAIPAIGAGTTPGDGFMDLAAFGIAPQPITDEQALNFNVPAFDFGGRTYSRIGVVSNGYAVIGGATSQADIAYTPQNLPDPTAPNGVLAPYWSDLDGSGSPGVRIARLTGAGQAWLAIQWDVRIWGDTTPGGVRQMQLWIGLNGAEDISYSYGATTIGADTPTGTGLTIGAENLSGTAGAMISGTPQGSYVVTSTPGQPGGSLTYSMVVKGMVAGDRTLTTDVTSDVVSGTTTVRTGITVN